MLRDDEHYYWLLDIHHIIGDGSTLKVLLDDIGAAYEGKELAPETITMAELAGVRLRRLLLYLVARP